MLTEIFASGAGIYLCAPVVVLTVLTYHLRHRNPALACWTLGIAVVLLVAQAFLTFWSMLS